jgi:hypothetical protein
MPAFFSVKPRYFVRSHFKQSAAQSMFINDA